MQAIEFVCFELSMFYLNFDPEISQFQQQKSAPRLSSDSRSHAAGSIRDHMVCARLFVFLIM